MPQESLDLSQIEQKKSAAKQVIGLLIEYNFGNTEETVTQITERFLEYIRREDRERKIGQEKSASLGRQSKPGENFIPILIDTLITYGLVKKGEINTEEWTQEGEQKIEEVTRILGGDSKPWKDSKLPKHTKWT